MVGWIDPSGVPLPSSISGVNPSITTDLPSQLPVPSALNCNTDIAFLSYNIPDIGSEGLGDQQLGDADREYVLDWMFLFAANTNPATTLGGDFSDPLTGSTSATLFSNFVNTPTNYKLVNRFQVKYAMISNNLVSCPRNK